MTQPTITLNDGRTIPQLGFGVWQVPDADARSVVRTAIEAGYRSIDTAAIYGNETGVGEAIADSPVPRDELFITTKLWNDRHAYDDALRAFDESARRLRLDVVDLYLIHWPAAHRGRFVEAWKALVRLREEGRVRSIGVSNFNPPHLARIIEETGVTPALNQVELHPRFQQTALRAVHERLGIVTESWSPLGQGRLLEHPVLAQIAGQYGRTPAQIILRWHLDNGFVAIPKSANPERIRQNFAVLDFTLDDAARAQIATLDDARGKIGPDPETFG